MPASPTSTKAGTSRSECPILVKFECAEFGLAKSNRVFQHASEHRLKLARRARDHLENVRGGSLLLQGLAQLARARLHLVEQAYVLDRDHRLVGKSCGQLDLLCRKWPCLGAAENKNPDSLVLSQQRD